MMVLVALCSVAVIGLGVVFWVGENMHAAVLERNEVAVRRFKSQAEFFIGVLAYFIRTKTMMPKFSHRITKSNTGRQPAVSSAAKASLPSKLKLMNATRIKKQILAIILIVLMASSSDSESFP